ncbi:hypothetical protein [Solimonas soli]|uniref:hypothetical protein n=1 Tax=Solimonas soli TaxID=413479 RepID=UPI0004805E2B|nr:hypothetical protein [Solimonas soli]
MESDLFEASALGFRLRKPAAWRFVPGEWSPLARWKNSAGEDIEWLQRAHAPFCCAMGSHDSRRHVRPTLQVVARPLLKSNPALAPMLLEAQLEQMCRTYRNFELLDASSRACVAGCPATLIRGRFSLTADVDGEAIEMSVLTRGYIVFAARVAFSIGLSSSNDPRYYTEADFREIVASIEIR